ncbi:2-dehydro-3-deoxygluconokinase [Novosphingobium chloroacetimidivorans]|uniref:2-dehydro-3-deoxygluconokinase n=1 Tax=Novosphingobium chloroacetimidivorans TaxID=1428314 RepID=A0A7W7KAW1_9SPHN|nr:sugar kinase [Novosphingobium chloroacetimidivorans]MBB4858894.1 2-dehydro-3-deoxygluconokinase [Novosphingobium chloroacetimidivorans]
MVGKRITIVGEGMLELAPRARGGWDLGHGGDTLNSAIHLARLGGDVAFASALGTDAFSARLRAGWEAEGLDCSLLLSDPTREPGLYAIQVDEAGERSFAYWRGQSAARRLFELPESGRLAAAAARSDLLYFSLITLAILPESGRRMLLDIASQVRAAGGRVAFDGNYRPRLWASREEAMATRDEAIAHADIGLPTYDDEAQLSGERDADAVAAHWSGLGCGEVVVKQGGDGCRLPDGSWSVPPKVLAPVDTSGAGDAFNAAYLQARLDGSSPDVAAEQGHRLAGWVITRFGAIPPRDDEAPY